MILNEDIEKIKSSVNMVQIAQYYGFCITRNGFIRCPFHNDKHPSMRVYKGYLENDGYMCYVCGAGGTIFNFVMEYEGVSFEVAARRISDMFGIHIKDENDEISVEEKTEYLNRMVILEAERRISECNRIGMIEVSERINLYEEVLRNASPFGDLFCYVANKLTMLKAEWEFRFELLCKNNK